MFGKKQTDLNELLKQVQDPILEKSIVDAGFVVDVREEGDRVRIGLELPTPAWEAGPLLDQEIRRVLAGQVGDRKIEIAWGSNVKSARPAAPGGANLVPGARNIILFASGKGGVGKSTIATNVAASLASVGANVGLLDADIYGPSIPTMMGTREMPKVAEGGHKLTPIFRHAMKLMSIGFVVDPKEAMTWRGPMLNSALLQFIKDVEWGDLDYLILDLPPGTGDVQLTIAQNVKVAGAVLVSTPQDVALADVVRGKAMFDKVDIPTLGVVENMSSFECGNCGTTHHIFAHGGAARLANELGVPLLGEIPIELGVRESGDMGKPEVLSHPDSRAGRALQQVAVRIATQLAKQAALMSEPGKKASGGLRIIQ